ncbi:MAG: hypothetical protein H6813_03400 [Phycisphaeraceae bacterium]|nr:hypothetical protein [Phycisphaeraceae bacterium]MCB9846992.1 hypothetical protein [Phycisphaeraceae bacterium]
MPPQQTPRLRLVAPEVEVEDESIEVQRRLRRAEVVRENRAASQIPPLDAQAIFSRSIADQLDGGRAALLTPERRERLVALGRRLGMNQFNANLVIAQVQDAARRGEDLSKPAVQARLDLVQETLHRKRMIGAGVAIAAMLLAMGMFMALIGWVQGG